jgi:hypothetical protein
MEKTNEILDDLEKSLINVINDEIKSEDDTTIEVIMKHCQSVFNNIVENINFIENKGIYEYVEKDGYFQNLSLELEANIQEISERIKNNREKLLKDQKEWREFNQNIKPKIYERKEDHHNPTELDKYDEFYMESMNVFQNIKRCKEKIPITRQILKNIQKTIEIKKGL